MEKGKRQILTIVILVALLAISCVSFLLLSRNQEKKEREEEAASKITLLSGDKDKIQKLFYQTADTAMTFSKKDAKWLWEEDEQFPVRAEYIEGMLTLLSDLTSTRLVTEKCTDLAQYGLDKPQLTVKFAEEDGVERVLAVGDESSVASGCYAYLDDSSKVYIVSRSTLTEFDYTQEQMMEIPELPNIPAANVRSYQLIKGKKTITNNKVEEGDSDAIVDYSGLANIVYTGGISYKDDDSLMKKCGLKSPQYTVKIKYYTETDNSDSAENTKEKTYHDLCLYIGNQAKDGSYYVKIEGEEGIYLLSKVAMTSFLEIKKS